MQKKRKRKTQYEIKARADSKKRLQADGILPPDKPRLNRKKFAAEVWQEFSETMGSVDTIPYLFRAIGCMVGPDMKKVTPEEVGVLKMLKIAMETRKFENAQPEKESYKVVDWIDSVVLPIINL